jgi:hypothetical protein
MSAPESEPRQRLVDCLKVTAPAHPAYLAIIAAAEESYPLETLARGTGLWLLPGAFMLSARASAAPTRKPKYSENEGKGGAASGFSVSAKPVPSYRRLLK